MSDDSDLKTDPDELDFRTLARGKPDEHDKLSGDNFNWAPAPVADLSDLPEPSYNGQKYTNAWLDRHLLIDGAAEVLVGFGQTPAGHKWLVSQGWRFCDLQCEGLELLTSRAVWELDHINQQIWARDYKQASEADQVMLRDWRQDLKKCALWVIAQDPLDILKITAFTETDLGNAISPQVEWGAKHIWSLAPDVLADDGAADAVREDGMWLIEAYVLLSSVQNIEDLLQHKPIRDPRLATTMDEALIRSQTTRKRRPELED